MYFFGIHDTYGDGLAGPGYYKILLDGDEGVHMDQYGYGNAHQINTHDDPTLSTKPREME